MPRERTKKGNAEHAKRQRAAEKNEIEKKRRYERKRNIGDAHRLCD